MLQKLDQWANGLYIALFHCDLYQKENRNKKIIQLTEIAKGSQLSFVRKLFCYLSIVKFRIFLLDWLIFYLSAKTNLIYTYTSNTCSDIRGVVKKFVIASNSLLTILIIIKYNKMFVGKYVIYTHSWHLNSWVSQTQKSTQKCTTKYMTISQYN